jgi:PEP-CTERM motif
MKKISYAALATGLLLAASQASAETLTFDDLAVGTVLSNQYAAQGATFSANAFTGPGSSTSGEDWATNTNMSIVSAGGTDVGGLGSPSLVSGNLLRGFSGWLDEDGDPSFRITFASEATNFSATFAGVTTGPDVRLFVYNGTTLLGTVAGAGAATTVQFTLSYSAGPFTSVVVTPGSFDDWVGVDNISYTLSPVPEAGTWAMMGLGLSALALVRRRRAA